MEEASAGNTPGGEIGEQEYPVEDLLLFLLECGISESSVYGWHSGWDFPRLVGAFGYFKLREVEKQRDHTLAIALGASSMLSKKPLEKFLKDTEEAIGSGRKNEQGVGNMVTELNKMLGVLDG